MRRVIKQLLSRTDIILIILVSLIAYLPNVFQLGYYRDDWHVAWAGTMINSAKIFDLHITDRPFMGLIYSLTFSLLGNAPIAWQLYVVALRIVDGLLLLWLLREIWSNKRMATTLMALLFTIYPGFLQMPTASAYSNHLFGLGMGILSIVLTLKAVRYSQLWLKSLLTIISLFSGLICFLIMEYMISLEVVRVLLLGYLFISFESTNLIKKIWRLFKIWAPYLLVLFLFLVWRILIFKSARATTDVGSLIGSYIAQPGYMLAHIIVEIIKGVFNSLVLAWSVPFYNQTMTANPSNLLISLFLSLTAIALFLAFIYFGNRQNDWQSEQQEQSQWSKQAVYLGLLVTIANIVPVVLANREIRLTDTLDRYTLPASIGMAMLFVGLLYWMVRTSWRIPLMIALIGVSIFTHYNNTVFFKNFWNIEKQLWWQLSWRAPNLKPDTVLIPALPSPYMLAESYEVWGPANLLYGTREQPLRVKGEALNMESMHSIITRESFGRVMRRVQLTLDFKNSLVLSIPTPDSCLHAFDSNWLEFSENESLLVRQVAPMSEIDLILTEGSHNTPPEEIFGKEPEHTWCYYYQKANLARQKKDWAEIVRLGDEVKKKGYQPNDNMEWMPFYQGYAYLHRMDEANELASYIRSEEIAMKDFCTQFSEERINKLRKGSVDEFIVVNLCPQQ